jgi:hypothetical protein
LPLSGFLLFGVGLFSFVPCTASFFIYINIKAYSGGFPCCTIFKKNNATTVMNQGYQEQD